MATAPVLAVAPASAGRAGPATAAPDRSPGGAAELRHASARLVRDHLAAAELGHGLARRLLRSAPEGVERDRIHRVAALVGEDRSTLRALADELRVGRPGLLMLAAHATVLGLRTPLTDRLPVLRRNALDGLSLGIESKRLLWIGLQAVGDPVVARTVDLPRLIVRAEQQRGLLEPARIARLRTG